MAVVSQILPIFHVGEEPGNGGTEKRNPSGTTDAETGPTADAASASAAAANDDDADRFEGTVGETTTILANPEVSPEGKSSESADCVGARTTTEAVATATAPARDESSNTGVMQSTSDDASDRNLEEAVRTEDTPTSAAAAISTGDCGQPAGVRRDDEGRFPIETRDEQTKEAETDLPPQVRAESLSGRGGGESWGGRPGGTTDNDINVKKRESRAELGRTRSGSKASSKTSKRSVSAVSRRSGGGGKAGVGGSGGAVEPPANTPHLQVTHGFGFERMPRAWHTMAHARVVCTPFSFRRYPCCFRPQLVFSLDFPTRTSLP